MAPILNVNFDRLAANRLNWKEPNQGNLPYNGVKVPPFTQAVLTVANEANNVFS
jgi:hypothetical protein